MANEAADLSYCGQEVRRYDNDRFLTCLFAPAERRETLFALCAFNIEIAKTREVVSEPMLGQMRLQWWRDAVEAAYEGGAAPVHAVTQPLAEAIRGHGLTRGHFDRLIDAREADLDDEPPASLDCLVNYADATAAPLVLLALETLGMRDAAAAEAGQHAAVAYALAGLLRAVPHLARQNRVLLPADRLAAHGVRVRDVIEGKAGDKLRPVVREVAERAREHLAKARAVRREVPRAAVPALLGATLADIYLGVLAREDHEVLAARVQMPHPMRQLKLAWAAVRGRY
ncbi:phytoene/squalene synthase family protein [Azospirillum sp. TSO22-1]|uniref:phytoene/squalene synthase family protein n=1 Tax=Azospirillum sp. TSO22-1 TaxID=716789 RepID=UPI000D61BD61|nr:phytoene/squalene synthase family protein [Azospirillum sp. TSO22-1]PWC55529.1 phytoene synthase [Azospirillum sp. TSO22-1]